MNSNYTNSVNSQNPVVSVITAVFNGSATIEESIKNVINQTYSNIEYIIIDGGSTDDTLDIIDKYKSNIAYVSSGSDKGIYDAMNKGITAAKGEWIFFLGCDDYIFDENVFSNIFTNKALVKNNDVIYGDVFFQNAQCRYDGEYDVQKIMWQNICHQSIFYHRSVFDKFGKFSLEYPMLADWEFNIRWFAEKKIRRSYVNQIVALYNEKGSSANTGDPKFHASYYKLLFISFPFWEFLSFSIKKIFHLYKK